MTYYIENRSTNPFYNLALEQVVFDRLDTAHNYLMLWQNDNSIIIGKHQNTLEEINTEFVKERSITVARRLSGGGAVYHDLGNLNFTIIAPAANRQNLDFSFFCEPIRKALCSFGVPAEISGRNDMTVNGKKISGNAQYVKNGRVMHHGTILYDSNMDVLSGALKNKDKVESKAVKSVQSRVSNIRPFMKTDMDIDGFWAALVDFLVPVLDVKKMELPPELHAEALNLEKNVYSQWAWNYGNSPPFTLRKTRRIEGCGKIDIFVDTGREGKINNIAFYGDFFGTRDLAELSGILKGQRLESGELGRALTGVDISQYFHALTLDGFLSLLLD